MDSNTDGKTRRVILKSSATPVYRQVADHLERDVLSQRKLGGKIPLPSENALATEFDVSRVTIRQALDRLHFKGLIYREKGKGSYIRSLHLGGVTGLGSFTTEVELSGGEPDSKLVSFEETTSLPDGMLQHVVRPLLPTDAFLLLSRVRLVGGVPVAKEDAYLPKDLYPGFSAENLGSGSLYQMMRDTWGYEPAWADVAIEPSTADADLAAQLEIEVGAPVVVAWRVTSSEQDQVLEFVRSVYRGDGFALTINRHKLG
ncbi:GntR family transcriptional regulator [Falsihalocynthiibacter sp. S25ZX9]|uniref:GntR family transcriptional regulator n=1 Tax=Falsihalocynthiibacter sp. S25ZX9 TaxID=3240870 RepID=UPI00350F84C3